MEGRGQAVYSDKGKPIRLYGIGIDITARKQAEGASERFRILSERARDIIFLLRPDGTILEANEAAAGIYGYSRDELLKLKVHELRAPSTLSQLDVQLAKANHEGILFETLHRRKDGTDFPVEVNSIGAEIGGAFGGKVRSFRAKIAAWTRLFRWSFLRMWRRWILTVCSEIPKVAPISLLLAPSPRQLRISRSLGVRGPWFVEGAEEVM